MTDSDAAAPRYFPITLRLDDARVVVVGGGEIAARKIRLLLRAGPRIDIVSRALNAELQGLRADGAVAHLAAEFEPSQLEGARLVIAATDDKALNRVVAAEARARNIPVNVVDDPEPSTFITPAIIERPPLTLAISTGGAAPVLARRLRERLEAELPQSYGDLAAYTQSRRDRVKSVLDQPKRRALWERFLDSAGAEAVLRGAPAAAGSGSR